jgi:predicted TIM-barrel fold metal-dependent hydrolase
MRCDAHVHVVGPTSRDKQIPTRTYLAAFAPLEELREKAATRMISRFVLVQPSFYGTDNSLLLESLDQLGSQGRGVAVTDPTAATPRMLAEFSARGIRGLRINLYSPLGDTMPLAQRFDPTADCARAANWHVEVIASPQVLIENGELLSQARVPIVVDHYGLYGKTSPDSADGRRLLELLGQPHVWTKLSAPYRNSDDPLDTRPNPAWLSAILAVAEERCVWGSDWPHTPPHSAHHGSDVLVAHRALSYPALVDDFLAALGSERRADRIMRDNPGRLYDFPNLA